MRAALWGLAAGGLGLFAAYLLDRILLKMEARGWIYYRRKRGHVDRMGQSALHIQALLEPGKRHELVEREKVRREEAPPGAPPA